MAIPKKPGSEYNESHIQRFIAQAEKKSSDEPYAITLRLSRAFLDRIDAAAKHQHISRSAWIKTAMSKSLDEQDK